MEQTYIHEGIEVKKTGRTAQRPLKSGKVDQLIEITPIGRITDNWKKWVREDDLYKVGDDDGIPR